MALGVALGVGGGVALGVALGVGGGVAFGVGGGVALGVLGGVAVGVAFGMLGGDVAFGMLGGDVVRGVAEGVALGVAEGVALGVVRGMALGMAFGVALGVALGMLGGVVEGLVVGVVRGVAYGVVEGVAVGVALGVAEGVALGVAYGVAFGVTFGVSFSLSSSIFILRIENWLLGFFLNCFLGKKSKILLLKISRITILPLPSITFLLKNWLTQDWEIGIYNLNQLLRYSLQFIPVVTAINQVITKFPSEQLIYRIFQLTQNSENRDLVKFTTVSLSNQMKLRAIKLIEILFFFLPHNWRENFKARFCTEPRLDTYPHAVAAGFWYLYEENPLKAKEAFEKVRSILYGEEMYAIANILSQFLIAKDLETIAKLNIETFPPEPYLQPTTWETLKILCSVVEDIQLIQRGSNRLIRSSALNRAIGNLQEIININNETSNPKQVPKTLQDLILDISKTWQTALQNIAKDIGEITIREHIANPYVIGSPVEGKLFSGREDICRGLKELWISGQNMQSVVLYGHRRMGKTSILRNIHKYLDNRVILVYTNLQILGAIQHGIGEVLYTISRNIVKTLKIELFNKKDISKLTSKVESFNKKGISNLTSTDLEELLEEALRILEDKCLIIALDEFETLEELIESQKIPVGFIAVLKTLSQKSSKLGFILAGLHTLEEKVGNYDEPFFASFIPIRVSFLDKDSTYYLLAEPDDDFSLNYSEEVLEEIYRLTSGQPFLVQLIGFRLASRYNKLLLQSTSLQNTLTLEDLNAIINDELFQRGNYYFNGVWKQAREGVIGQHDILKALAPYPEGLNQSELLLSLNQNELREAIETLKRHDVIQENDSNLKIIVELFRRWLCFQGHC